ncbi:MAG: nucleoside phosphorylase [Bacteroidota bacterium]|jgi:uridine phosphorylase
MNPIASSELIINNRGAIYHLDLRPDEMGDIIITVGDPFRVEKVSRYFDRVEHKSNHREFITHTGWIGSQKISVVSTGIGPDNIDIVFNELDALANIDFDTRTEKKEKKRLKCIRIGTSGSLQKDIDVDSFVASTHAVGLDNLMHYYARQDDQHEIDLLSQFKSQVRFSPNIQPYATTGNAGLISTFADMAHCGITVTCPGFYGPQGRVLRVGLANPNLNHDLTAFSWGNQRILNFEMETAAIYGLGRLLGHECMSLSAIVANRLAGKFSSDADATMDKLIRTTLERI